MSLVVMNSSLNPFGHHLHPCNHNLKQSPKLRRVGGVNNLFKVWNV